MHNHEVKIKNKGFDQKQGCQTCKKLSSGYSLKI